MKLEILQLCVGNEAEWVFIPHGGGGGASLPWRLLYLTLLTDSSVRDGTLHLLYLLHCAKNKYSLSMPHQCPAAVAVSPKHARTHTHVHVCTCTQTHTDAIACQYRVTPHPSHTTLYFLHPPSVFPFIFSSFFPFCTSLHLSLSPHNADKANKEPSGEMGQCYSFIS